MLLIQKRFGVADGLLKILFIAFALYVTSSSHALTLPQSESGILFRQLRDLPTPLPSSVPSNGVVSPEERRRDQVYEQIRHLGPKGVVALSKALQSNDVQLRKNAALALNVLAGDWFNPSWSKLDIKLALHGLISALQDSEPDVRAWSAHAIGEIGPDAESAVPQLITLLANQDEGSRNSACIALRGIGPRAKAALPALRNSLSDPSNDVRRFAELAINSQQAKPQAIDDRVYTAEEVDVKAKITNKMENIPQNGSDCPHQGMVSLRIVLHKSGRVTDIAIIKGMGCSYDKATVETARKFKFTTAVKNGQPVSQYQIFEYRYGDQ